MFDMSQAVPLIYAQEDAELGGREAKYIEDDFAYRNNVAQASQQIRLGFLRKVYGLLTIQLLATVAVGAVFSQVDQVKDYIHRNDWMMIVAFILSIVTLIALISLRKESPANLYLLAAFTVVQAYTIGVLVSYFEQQIVLQAILLTLTVTLGITLFTLNTKKDFTFLGYGLFAGLLVLIVAGILQLFVRSSALELVVSIGGAILFSLFLLYDTQQMMSHLSAEEYILATINLYMDILNLFIYILRILQSANRN